MYLGDDLNLIIYESGFRNDDFHKKKLFVILYVFRLDTLMYRFLSSFGMTFYHLIVSGRQSRPLSLPYKTMVIPNEERNLFIQRNDSRNIINRLSGC